MGAPAAVSRRALAVRVLGICRSAVDYISPVGDAVTRDPMARLLFGTAAAESCGFATRGTVDDERYGLWGADMAVVDDALRTAPPGLARSSEAWLVRHGCRVSFRLRTDHARYHRALLRSEPGDYLGCVVMLLHYLRVGRSVPVEIDNQAVYWWNHYGCRHGCVGNPRDWVERYRRTCLPVMLEAGHPV